MENYIKILIALGLCYGLVHWSVTNPASAESMVDKVGSALTSGADFISENLFDDETDNEKRGE